MNANLMRWIDRWLGIPLCFLLTIFNRLKRVFGGKDQYPNSPTRILFIELAESGALVAAYPAIAQVKRHFPQAEIYFLTFSRGSDILLLMGAVDRDHLITIRPLSLMTFLKDTFQVIARLRQEHIEATINLEPFARFSTLLAYLFGARQRVGFFCFNDQGSYTGDLITHKVIYNPHLHAAQTYLTLVEALIEEADPEPRAKTDVKRISLDLPRHVTSNEARRDLLNRLRKLYPNLDGAHRLVLLNPNAGDLIVARRWPDENFLALARDLLKRPDILVLLTGSPDERPRTEVFAKQLSSDRVLNVAGLTSLPQLLDLYNLAAVLVTNDSGPAHFASLTDIPVLVLFGPETPDIFGPLGPNVEIIYLGLACSPCVSVYNQKKSPCRINRCLTDISLETVEQKVEAILDTNHRKIDD